MRQGLTPRERHGYQKKGMCTFSSTPRAWAVTLAATAAMLAVLAADLLWAAAPRTGP